jgi:hypothetical protein
LNLRSVRRIHVDTERIFHILAVMRTHRTAANRVHDTGSFAPRHLYVAPNRTARRASYVPVGRTLHLLDLENLMGGALAGSLALRRASATYRETMSIGPDDHVIVAVNPALGLEAKLEWPDRQVIMQGGPDGADMALLSVASDEPWVTARYDRLIIASGDGIFAGLASSIRGAGIPVGVVALDRSLAYVLAHAATFVRIMPEPRLVGAA